MSNHINIFKNVFTDLALESNTLVDLINFVQVLLKKCLHWPKVMSLSVITPVYIYVSVNHFCLCTAMYTSQYGAAQ